MYRESFVSPHTSNTIGSIATLGSGFSISCKAMTNVLKLLQYPEILATTIAAEKLITNPCRMVFIEASITFPKPSYRNNV